MDEQTFVDMLKRWRDWNSTAMTPITCADEAQALLNRLHGLVSLMRERDDWGSGTAWANSLEQITGPRK